MELFLSNMPDDIDTEMAFVVVQHMPADYKSMLPDLLKKHTVLLCT